MVCPKCKGKGHLLIGAREVIHTCDRCIGTGEVFKEEPGDHKYADKTDNKYEGRFE